MEAGADVWVRFDDSEEAWVMGTVFSRVCIIVIHILYHHHVSILLSLGPKNRIIDRNHRHYFRHRAKAHL